MYTMQLKIVLIEDNPADVRFIRELLSEDGKRFSLCVKESLAEGLAYLKAEAGDLVLLDLNLPDSNGMATFDKLHLKYPEQPVIILTGIPDEELAVAAIKKGAQDYLAKGHFDRELLIRAMHYSVERQKLLRKLEDTLLEIRTLKGLLPICSYCKKIKDDKGYWESLEAYISERSEAQFSHGICPACAQKYFSDILETIKDDKHKPEGGDP